MDNTSDPPSKKPRNWRSISVRGMLLLVLLIGIPMGWWARKAQLQRAAVAKIVAANGAVLYGFEVLDDDGGASPEATTRIEEALTKARGYGIRINPSTVTPSINPWKNWARRTLGVDYVDSVTQVIAVHTDRLKDDDLSVLADLPNLDVVNLGESPINDRALAAIGQFRGLKRLYLDSANLTDAGVAHLAGLDQLEHLGFSGSGPNLTDAALVSLKRMKKLQVLNISGRGITDAGLRTLEGLTSLYYVLINAPNVTTEGLNRLRSALAKLEVLEWR